MSLRAPGRNRAPAQGRGDTDQHERLSAWDDTLLDLRSADPSVFTLTLNTSVINARRAAEVIDSFRA